MPKSQKNAPGAIDLLKEDHAKVKKAFKAFEKMDKEDTEAVKELVTTVCEDLKAHTTIEEEIFYPAVREEIDDDDLMNEAQIEHQSAKDLIAQIQDADPGDALYDARVNVLGEYVKHHVQEEEGELFLQVREAGLDLEALGAELSERQEELLTAEEELDED